MCHGQKFADRGPDAISKSPFFSPHRPPELPHRWGQDPEYADRVAHYSPWIRNWTNTHWVWSGKPYQPYLCDLVKVGDQAAARLVSEGMEQAWWSAVAIQELDKAFEEAKE